VNPVLGVVLRILGIGALVAGGFAVALGALASAILLGPLLFWVAWNVLDFGHALGLPELGFWGIVLATLFLVIGCARDAAGLDRRGCVVEVTVTLRLRLEVSPPRTRAP